MHEHFKEEFEATSASKIRTGKDMQFAFSYFYFLIYEENKLQESRENSSKNILEGLQIFDTDASGTLSTNEQRTMALRYYNGVEEYESDLRNCSLPVEAEITFEELLNCSKVSHEISSVMDKASKKLNKYQLLQDSEVAFKMLRSNASQLLSDLDDLRKNPKKFICLNDNFNYLNASESLKLHRILRDFYESLFPFPSQFEKVQTSGISGPSVQYSIYFFILLLYFISTLTYFI